MVAPQVGVEDVNFAESVLRGLEEGPSALLQLASRLVQHKAYGLARRVLARAARTAEARTDAELRRRIAIALAVATSHDPELPEGDRLGQAMEHLASVDDLARTVDQELLALSGDLHGRRWELYARKEELERALAYYLRGYQGGVRGDLGHSAVRAALALDLLDHVEREPQSPAGPAFAPDRRARAQEIRRDVTATLLGMLGAPDGVWLAMSFPALTALGEAHLGLGEDDAATERLAAAWALRGVADWSRESTARRLAWVARLRTTSEAGTSDAGAPGPPPPSAGAWPALTRALGLEEGTLRRLTTGRLGLALSGGGFRAALFHVGLLARLAELDLLRSVEVLSCVSGGSVVGAHYYLALRALLASKTDAEITRDDYIAIVRRMERDVLAGIQRNIRARSAASFVAAVRSAFVRDYSRAQHFGETVEDEILRFAKAPSESSLDRAVIRGRLLLEELGITPRGEESGFDPVLENWRRAAKVPELVLNATTLNSGHNWQFTVSWMGESIMGSNERLGGAPRLRRVRFVEAPRRFRSVPLSTAVAASACSPGLYEPITFTGLYPDYVVRLVDGGVNDNQAQNALLERDCALLVVSDASGQIPALRNPPAAPFGVYVRATDILFARVREAQYRELEARLDTSLIRGLAFVHLRKGLEDNPVAPVGAPDSAWVPAADDARGPLTEYGVRRDVQARLAAIRSDYDAFTDVEAYALMLSGYLMAGYEVPRALGGVAEGWTAPAMERPTAWRFFAMHEAVTRTVSADVLTLLDVASKRAFKTVRLIRPLQVLVVLAVAIGLALLAWRAVRTPDATVINARTLLGVAVAAAVAVAGAAGVASLLGLAGKEVAQVFSSLFVGLISWIPAVTELALLDRLYLARGRLAYAADEHRPSSDAPFADGERASGSAASWAGSANRRERGSAAAIVERGTVVRAVSAVFEQAGYIVRVLPRLSSLEALQVDLDLIATADASREVVCVAVQTSDSTAEAWLRLTSLPRATWAVRAHVTNAGGTGDLASARSRAGAGAPARGPTSREVGADPTAAGSFARAYLITVDAALNPSFLEAARRGSEPHAPGEPPTSGEVPVDIVATTQDELQRIVALPASDRRAAARALLHMPS